jgi:hypothetical protein
MQQQLQQFDIHQSPQSPERQTNLLQEANDTSPLPGNKRLWHHITQTQSQEVAVPEHATSSKDKQSSKQPKSKAKAKAQPKLQPQDKSKVKQTQLEEGTTSKDIVQLCVTKGTSQSYIQMKMPEGNKQLSRTCVDKSCFVCVVFANLQLNSESLRQFAFDHVVLHVVGSCS